MWRNLNPVPHYWMYRGQAAGKFTTNTSKESNNLHTRSQQALTANGQQKSPEMMIRYLTRANYSTLKTFVPSGKPHRRIDGHRNNSAHPLKSATHRRYKAARSSRNSVALSPCRCIRITAFVLLGTTNSPFDDTPALTSKLGSLPTQRGVIDVESVVLLRLSTKHGIAPCQFLVCPPRTKVAIGWLLIYCGPIHRDWNCFWKDMLVNMLAGAKGDVGVFHLTGFCVQDAKVHYGSDRRTLRKIIPEATFFKFISHGIQIYMQAPC